MSYLFSLGEFSIMYEMLWRSMLRRRDEQRREQQREQQLELEPTLIPEELFGVVAGPSSSRSNFYHKWKKNATGKSSKLISDNDKFVVIVDILHFKAKDIAVKTANGYLVVEGKHEQKKDTHGTISRQFVRRYALPDDVMLENIRSKISADGVLTITAPRNSTVRGVRNVPIEVSSELADLPCRSSDEPMSPTEDKKEDPKVSKESQKDKHLKMLLKK